MNLLLILLAMLSGLPGAMVGARGVQAAEVQRSQSCAAAVEQHTADAVAAGHRLLAHPQPTIMQLSGAVPVVSFLPPLPIRSIVEIALE